MIAGRYRDVGGLPWRELVADQVLGATFDVPAGMLVKLSAFVDGGGSGYGDQPLRGVVYRPSGELLSEAPPVVVTEGQAAGWIDLCLTTLNWPGGELVLGVQAGAPSLAARVAHDAAVAGLYATDTYADGAAAALGAQTATSGLAIFATVAAATSWPDVPDLELARLPFWSAQARLVGPPARQQVQAQAEWHGTSTDPERGAFALVNEDGPLADLVGERLLVSHGDRSVVVYCHMATALDEELSLTRRAFLQLGSLSAERLDVRVAVVP